MAELLVWFPVAVGLLLVVTAALPVVHRAGRWVATAVTGRPRTRPREWVRFTTGVAAEIAAWIFVFRAIAPDVLSDDTAPGWETSLLAALVTIGLVRPLMLVVMFRNAPARMVETRSLRYLITGVWNDSPTTWREEADFLRRARSATEQSELLDISIEVADRGDQHLAAGGRMDRRTRANHARASAHRAGSNGDHNAVIDITDSLVPDIITRALRSKGTEVDLEVMINRSHALLAVGRYADARGAGEMALDLAHSVGTDSELLADHQNRLAYILALHGQELDRAEQLVRAAMAVDETPAALGTLGAILVHSGHEEEGIPILRDVLDLDLSPKDEFETLLFLVHGLIAAGGGDEASALQRAADELAAEHGLEPPPFVRAADPSE